jgi:hypothetical protein
VGEWDTVGEHGLMPNITLHGHTSFEWIEGGAFLKMVSEMDDPRIPTGLAIIGSDNGTGETFMLYFDERGVSRKYDVTLGDNGWKYGRNAPDISQRITFTFANDGNTMIGKGEASEGGKAWRRDLDLTYTRVK